MKRILTATLAAALFLTGMTACGSKDNVNSYDTTSRVLYTDSDAQTDTESAESSEEESSKAEKKVVTTDSESSDKKKDSSSKKTSSKAASSKAASSKAAASKAASSKKAAAASRPAASTTTSRPTTTSSVPAASSSSSTDSTDTSSDIETDNQLTDTESETDTTIIDTESDTDSAAEAPSDPFDPSVDLSFSYGSTVIRLGDDIGDVVSAIGDPDSVTTAGNCLGGGEIKLYSYASYGFNIQAYPDGGDSFNVTVISLVNSDVMTEKGVKIGTSEEDMLAIYGDNYEAVSSTTYRYTAADGSYLQFYIEDGEVADIMMSLDTTNM